MEIDTQDTTSRARTNVLDEDAFSALYRGVSKDHRFLETGVYEILLTMRPLELEVVHAGSATGQMRGIVGRAGRVSVFLKIWCGNDQSQGLRSSGRVEWGRDFFSDVQNGLDASLDQTLPVASVVFRAEPNAGENLCGTVCIRDGVGAITVLLLAMEETCGVCG